jgi:tetratricopeptide (TPR) repeat protein
LERLDRALTLDPDFIAAYAHKAIILIVGGQNGLVANPDECYRQVRLISDKLFQLAPDSAGTHFVLGLLLHHDRKHEQARKEFELALSVRPNLAGAYQGLGWVCLQTGDYQKALSAAQRAKELSPFPIMMNFELEALALQLLGRSEEALVIVKRGLALQPKDLFLWVTFVGLVAPMGLKEECALARQKILEIQPNFDSVRYATSTGMFDAETAKKYAAVLHMIGLP